MISGTVSGNLDELAAFLDGFEARFLADLSDLADRVGVFVVEANRRGILAGTNSTGAAMAPLKAGRRSGRGGSGPPLAPHGATSRVISAFKARVLVDNLGTEIIVRAGYGDFAEIVRYFQTGSIHMPARPVAGIRPDDEATILRMVAEFAQHQAARFG